MFGTLPHQNIIFSESVLIKWGNFKTTQITQVIKGVFGSWHTYCEKLQTFRWNFAYQKLFKSHERQGIMVSQ